MKMEVEEQDYLDDLNSKDAGEEPGNICNPR